MSAFSWPMWLWLMWGNSMMSWVGNNMKKHVFLEIQKLILDFEEKIMDNV